MILWLTTANENLSDQEGTTSVVPLERCTIKRL